METNVGWKRVEIRFRAVERLRVYLLGTTVLFAAFGMGEAVYRLLFSEFDGATDRIPIEALCGLVLAWIAITLLGSTDQHRRQTTSRLTLIRARNRQIRSALEAISPLAHPIKNQQSIRVIREELDKIESELKEMIPRHLPLGENEEYHNSPPVL